MGRKNLPVEEMPESDSLVQQVNGKDRGTVPPLPFNEQSELQIQN